MRFSKLANIIKAPFDRWEALFLILIQSNKTVIQIIQLKIRKSSTSVTLSGLCLMSF